MDQPKENDSITSEEIENDQGKINFSDLWNGKPDSPMTPKGKYVCRDCDEFSTDERASLDAHYFEHNIYRTKCEQCDYSHEYPSVLKSHVQSVHEKIRQKCNLCELTYATKSGVRRHVKNVHGPIMIETDTDSSTDENDGDSDDTDNDENSTDEDSDIDEATESSSDEGDHMETGTPVPNAGDIETTKWTIHDDPQSGIE
jgi:hypothetical protein